MANYVCSLGFLTYMFIVDRIDRELHSLERLELKFDSSLEFFDQKNLLESFLMCSLVCSGFLKRLYISYALASSFMTI